METEAEMEAEMVAGMVVGTSSVPLIFIVQEPPDFSCKE